MIKAFLVGMCLCTTTLTSDTSAIDINNTTEIIEQEETNIEENSTEVLTDDTENDIVDIESRIDDIYIDDYTNNFIDDNEIIEYSQYFIYDEPIEKARSRKKNNHYDDNNASEIFVCEDIPFYKPYTVMTIVDKEEDIAFIEETYNFTLKSYENGVATFDTNEQDPLKFAITTEEDYEKIKNDDVIIFSLVYYYDLF